METYLTWGQKSKVKVTSHINLDGVGLWYRPNDVNKLLGI